MFRAISGNINGLGSTLSAGKWKVEVAPPPESGWLSAGDDVDARVRYVRSWVQRHGGDVTDESGQFTSSNVDIEFQIPGSSNWDILWAVPKKDLSFVDGIRDAIKEESRGTIDYADDKAQETIDHADEKAQERLADAARRAEALSRQANLDAQHTIADADSRASARIVQGRDAMLLVAVVGISIAAVVYITVSPSK